MARRRFGNSRKLPSGRYQASYCHPDSAERIVAPQTYTTARDARKTLRLVMQDVHRAAVARRRTG